MKSELHSSNRDYSFMPELFPYMETASTLIKQHSLANWANDVDSVDYQLAHLHLCVSLYRYSTLSAENKRTQADFQLFVLANTLKANENCFKEYYRPFLK